MTCVTCARTAPAVKIARGSAASQTCSTLNGFARETLAHPLLPRAFKRAGDDAGPDEQTELLTVWWQARCSLIKRRQHVLSQTEALLRGLPLALIERLPDSQAVRPRLAALARATRRRRFDPPNRLRLTLLSEYRAEIAKLDHEEKQVTGELATLVQATGSTLEQLCGLSTVSVAELLVEVGDPRRFTEGGFARFNGTAPLAASTAEGPGEPIRHRFNPGGNRRVNAILYRMALTQLRLRTARPGALHQRARPRAHQERGPSDPQTPPLRRHPPPHDPRSRRAPRRPRGRLTSPPAKTRARPNLGSLPATDTSWAVLARPQIASQRSDPQPGRCTTAASRPERPARPVPAAGARAIYDPAQSPPNLT